MSKSNDKSARRTHPLASTLRNQLSALKMSFAYNFGALMGRLTVPAIIGAGVIQASLYDGACASACCCSKTCPADEFDVTHACSAWRSQGSHL